MDGPLKHGEVQFEIIVGRFCIGRASTAMYIYISIRVWWLLIGRGSNTGMTAAAASACWCCLLLVLHWC